MRVIEVSPLRPLRLVVVATAALALLGALPASDAQMLVKSESKRATVCNGYI